MFARSRSRLLIPVMLTAVFVAALLCLPGTAMAAGPAKVAGLKISKVTASSVTLTWSKAKGAKTYFVYQRAMGAKKWTSIGTLGAASKKLSFTTKKKLSATANYEFSVRAKSSTFGPYATEVVDFARRPARVLVGEGGVTFDNGDFIARWEKSTGAATYRVAYELVPNPESPQYSDETTFSYSIDVTGTAVSLFAIAGPDDDRLLNCTITPISKVGVAGSGYSERGMVPNRVFAPGVGTVLPAEAGDATSTLRCLIETQTVVATFDAGTDFMVDGARDGNEAAFRSALAANPNAPCFFQFMQRHTADGTAYTYISMADIYPGGRVVPFELQLMESADNFVNYSAANGLITFVSPDTKRSYTAIIDEATRINVRDCAPNKTAFFTWLGTHPTARVFYAGERLATPIVVDGIEVDYHVGVVNWPWPPGFE